MTALRNMEQVALAVALEAVEAWVAVVVWAAAWEVWETWDEEALVVWAVGEEEEAAAVVVAAAAPMRVRLDTVYT